jgi:integrase
MPRRRSAPRLYLDSQRKQWVIRDGSIFQRTGCAEDDRSGAERQLAGYLVAKHRPEASATPMIADVLNVYATEHLPNTRTKVDASYHVQSLARWWGDKNITDVTSVNCREYAKQRSTPTSARRDLECLRAAIHYWHRHRGPLNSVPAVVLPPKPGPRERWLTVSEAARLLWAARRSPHLARFILLGLKTGSRSAVLLSLQWNWFDLKSGTMRRRAPGVVEDKRKRTPEIRLGRKILGHLRRWRRNDPHATHVIHYNGRQLKKIRHAWETAVQRAGLDSDVTPHCLRRTAATWQMQRAVPIWELAGFLGMTTQVLERDYGKHHPDHQKRAADF